MEEKQVNNENEEFPLYTEKIVVNPKKKYKRLINILWVILCAVIFGILASFVMVIVFPMINKRFNEVPKTPIHLELNKDEYIIKDDVEEDEKDPDIGQAKPQEAKEIKNIEEIVENALKSMVVIDYGTQLLQNEENQNSQSVGLIVGDVNDNIIILTSTYVTSKGICNVFIGDSISLEANILGSDNDSGLSIISISKRNISDIDKIDYNVAVLGNSYMLQENDKVIAIGKLEGNIVSANVGKIVSLDTESVVDNVYDILNTNINVDSQDYCFLYNNIGNVVGISRDNAAQDQLSVMGVSNLKALIERLTENKPVNYLGIKMSNITPSISEKYNLPMGIYITSVVIDSPAYNAGLQAGDVIVALNHNPVLAIQSFNEQLYQYDSGQNINVTVKRAGRDNYRELLYVINPTVRN